MTARKNDKHRRLGSAVALTGICTTFGIASAHAETHFEPRIGFDATWVDNVTLAPPGSPKRDELIGQVTPGITLVHEGRNLVAYADYQLQGIYFHDTSDTQVFHQAEIGVQYTAIPEWLFIDASGTRNQTVVDPRQPSNVDNLFQVSNLADATSAQISPIIRHKFRLADLEASYTRGFLNYSRAGNARDVTPVDTFNFDDSKNENASFSLRSSDDDARLTWLTLFNHDKVDYKIADTYQYDQAAAELGLRVAPSWRLIGRAGLESDLRTDTSKGGLDESNWAGGVEWRQGERMVLRLLTGHRFFGTTYEGLWRYTGRILESDVSYVESPTTQTQSHVIRGITAPGGFRDEIDPTFSRTTSDVYILKQLNGRIGMRGRVTEIFLSVNSERREYITTTPGLDDEYKGAAILVGRRLGPRVRVEVTAAYIDTKLREGDSYNEYAYAARFERLIGNRTSLTLTGNRVDRSGGGRPYVANWVVLGLQVNFAGNEANARRGAAGLRRTDQRGAMPTIPAHP